MRRLSPFRVPRKVRRWSSRIRSWNHLHNLIDQDIVKEQYEGDNKETVYILLASKF